MHGGIACCIAGGSKWVVRNMETALGIAFRALRHKLEKPGIE